LQHRTSQIQTVVTAIDTEVQNLSGLVAGFTSGVEASQSAFDSIQGATAEVVQIGLTITASSTEIAEAAGSTASYISEIAQLADRTADLTRTARQQSEAMGNQAQQLLQGIQFFQLPEGTAAALAKNIPTTTSASNVADGFVKEIPENNSQNLGIAVPVLGTLAAAVAATAAISQSRHEPNIEQVVVDSGDMGFKGSDEYTTSESFVGEISNTLLEEPDITSVSEFLVGTESKPKSEMFIAESRTGDSFEAFVDRIGDQREISPSELTIFPELNDISIIEQSLLADLKQEVYSESIDESSFDEESQDYQDSV
jgi:hypothetical protein